MRVINVLLAATVATFIFCCADGAVTSKRSLRSYDMNDLNNETKNDEERMIKFNNMEKIDDFFGSPAKFEKIFDPKKVTEAFAGGKKLDDWLDQATLDKLLASSPKEMRPTFTQVGCERNNC
ncbi:hypothetical protein PR003_g16812 [Phytophthora rubi]|uniref:RxLR effector protein n=1 Tax=Phytophthora rubi TaxID=129364 RepID=A0A6A3KKR6_9STRA|nr:hypothetical protein PR002_g16595 [Phytophthora rubi]KAE9013006.1 hypothetical protein PR001_g15520 [Phytophthora rubi]KAE9324119.1 hypothetical protein PR003_g16812 [Phytophthora rubi]